MMTWLRLAANLLTGLGLGLVLRGLGPAAIRDLRMSAQPNSRSAQLTWRYGYGTRPISIIFDLAAGRHLGSLSTDGGMSQGEMRLLRPVDGECDVTITATYRVLGIVRRRVQTLRLPVLPASPAQML